MANHSLKAAVERQHCSLRLTVCAVRKERERPRGCCLNRARTVHAPCAHRASFCVFYVHQIHNA